VCSSPNAAHSNTRQTKAQLLAQGLTPRDVSTLLGVSIANVVSLRRLAS
jgi:hypothetical protein